MIRIDKRVRSLEEISKNLLGNLKPKIPCWWLSTKSPLRDIHEWIFSQSYNLNNLEPILISLRRLFPHTNNFLPISLLVSRKYHIWSLPPGTLEVCKTLYIAIMKKSKECLEFDLLWASIWQPICQNCPSRYLLSYGQSKNLLESFPLFLLLHLEPPTPR